MKIKARLEILVPISLLTLAPVAGWSQTVTPNPTGSQASDVAGLSEIVVTAQKREERLLDVPISIAAVSGEDLEKRQLTSLEDLPMVVPDLAFNNIGNNHYFEIRGISNLVGNAPLVGIYIDEADVTLGGAAATQVNPTVYDIDRVEVLRGPQGTLYGEGSAGGAIHFVTKNPDLNKFIFGADVASLFTENGGPSERVNSVVNIPLIDNQLGVRVAGTFQHEGGWIDQPAAGLKDINSEDMTNVRVKGLWQPASEFTASAMAIINRDEKGIDVTDINNPRVFTQTFDLTATPRATNNSDVYNLTLTYRFPVAQILNTATYIKDDAPWTNQTGLFQFSPPGTTPYNYYAPIQATTDHAITDELRLSSLGEAPWQWTVGGFLRTLTATSRASH